MKLNQTKKITFGLIIFLFLISFGIFTQNEKIVLLSFLGFPIGTTIQKAFENFLENQRIKKIENDLPGLLITASSASCFVSEGNLLQFLVQNSQGELNKELKLALAQNISGMPLPKALEKVGERNKSELIVRAMKLISNGIENGSDMTETYLGASEDFSEVLRLENEKNAVMVMQKITLFAGCLIVPFIIGNVVSVNQNFESQSLENMVKLDLGLISTIYVLEYCLITSLFLGALDGFLKTSFFYAVFLLPIGLTLFLFSSGLKIF
ncbi:MAG: type II secretion system F family protein [Candidatus Diapherotrites archaeon]